MPPVFMPAMTVIERLNTGDQLRPPGECVRACASDRPRKATGHRRAIGGA